MDEAFARSVTWNRSARRLRARRFLVAAVAAMCVPVVGFFGVPTPAKALWAPPPLPDLASVEASVGAQQSWLSGAYGQGVDVAVIDTGVTPVAGLNSPGKLVYGPDLSFDSQDPATADLDGYGHGTAMASIIAGNDLVPGGFKGVAPGSRVVSVKVGASNGATDVSQIIAAIDWIAQHAHDPGMNIRVLNLSLGTDSWQYYANDPLATAAENAWKHGIVVVAATGNENTSNSVADPATDPYVVAVAASDPVGTVQSADDQIPSWSNRGTGSRQPDLVAPGAYVMGLNVPGSTLAANFPNAVFGRYLRGSGTSQAAAMVSGAAADVLSAHPDYGPDQVKAALTRSATRIAVNNPNRVGNGELNIPGALTSSVNNATQNFPTATGKGSLEAARGSVHVQLGGVTLSGEQDIFGTPWLPAVMVPAEQGLTAWDNGVYNSVTWSGNTWTSVTWSGATWASVTWSGATWSSVTWSSVTWSSVTWSSVTWSSVTWSGATWSGATWSASSWA